MNNKGQMVGIGMLISIAIMVIVGVILFQATAQQVGETTNTVDLVNYTLSSAVVNGTAQYITEYKSISDVTVLNGTQGAVVTDGNYTITNNVVYNGGLAIEILPDASASVKTAWKISGTAEPTTYISESGGRAMASLIVIFFALTIALIVLYPVYSEKMLQMLGK